MAAEPPLETPKLRLHPGDLHRPTVCREALGADEAHNFAVEWKGLGLIVTGMERQGYDISLTHYPEGWRATFIRRDHSTRPWVGQVLSFHATPWRAVQHAAWTVLDKDRDDPWRYGVPSRCSDGTFLS